MCDTSKRGNCTFASRDAVVVDCTMPSRCALHGRSPNQWYFALSIAMARLDGSCGKYANVCILWHLIK